MLRFVRQHIIKIDVIDCGQHGSWFELHDDSLFISWYKSAKAQQD